MNDLKCSLEKSRFGKTITDFLGHIVTAEANFPQDAHINAILEVTTPHSKTALQKFLGICGWIQECVPHFSDRAAPLTNLLGKQSRRWTWNPTAEKAFQDIKTLFRAPLQLARPTPVLPYTLQTDVSDIGMGAVLYRKKTDFTRNIISFSSAKLSPTEARYERNERECLAIIWALNKFASYLQGRSFTLRTNDEAVAWLHRTKDTRGKLRQWACQLDTYDFTIEKCLTSQSLLPVALAENPEGPSSEVDTSIDERLLPPETKFCISKQLPYLASVKTLDLYEELSTAQQTDVEIPGVSTL